jgi:glycosyl transferase family 25
LDFFDRIYVINLPYRVDRRKAMERELRRVKMPFKPGKVELFAGIRPETAGPFESIGYKGCFLSHLTILKQVKNMQLNNVLIMEDDLAIAPEFVQWEEHILQSLVQTSWDMVHFGYYPEHFSDSTTSRLVTLEPFSGEIIGAHFYAVNRQCVDRLITFMETLLQRPIGHPDGSPMPPDGAYNLFRWQNPEIVRLISVPSLGSQRSSRSDIVEDLDWYDRLPVFKQAATLARDLGVATWAKALFKRIPALSSGD